MKVHELIKQLQKMPQDANVVVPLGDEYGFHRVSCVEKGYWGFYGDDFHINVEPPEHGYNENDKAVGLI